MTPTAPSKPFVLPELHNARVWPVTSTSTPGLVHMVIRGDTPATPLEFPCPFEMCAAEPGQSCRCLSDGAVMPPHTLRGQRANRTFVTRWYCTGQQRPHNGPHCGPNCCHIAAVRAQLERETT